VIGLLVALALVAGLAACSDDTPDAVDTTTTSSPAATTTAPPAEQPLAGGRTPLEGFGEIEIRVVEGPDGETVVLCVLHAETPEQRRRGLMQVEDPTLGGYDGMLFAYPADTDGGFWMKDTLLPLSIAYLDADGAVVSTEDMEPCPPATERCPSYPPAGPYRWALEVVQGGLAPLGLTEGGRARVEVGGACAPRG
jgi:uncharacterized membrane protein (UPF0127 family)